MKQQPENFWNERYASEAYAYGILPNSFFKKQLDQLKPGKILLPAEGEGRNAVYAATQSWKALAFDISDSGRKKSLDLADKHQVNIEYLVSDVMNFQTENQVDVLALIYTHFPPNIRKEAHQHLLKFLKPGGTIIFEGFAKEQIENTSGGPQNIDMLYSIDEIKKEFQDLQFTLLETKSIDLQEGEFHQGKAEVIRFVGEKN